MRKRYISAVLVAIVLSGFTQLSAQSLPGSKVSGQDDTSARAKDDYGLSEARRDFRLLALSPEDAGAIGELTESDARELELARAEIRELQARLARLMLEVKPDMKAIEKTVRQSLDAEYRIRMAQIRRNIALREILGDKRWAALSRLPEPDRSLLYLRDAEGMKVCDLALAFGLPEGTIKSKLARSRARIRREAGGEWGTA